jgi:HlyD family secretion protein
VTLKGASSDRRLGAKIERGTMVKSVVATGKVEPTTKIEIKSNGIIKALNADVVSGQGRRHPRRVGQGTAARLRGAEANPLAAAKCSRPPKKGSSAKPWAGRRVRATRLRSRQVAVRASLISQSTLDDAHGLVDMATTASARRSRSCVSQPSGQARAQVAQAKAAADRASEDVANATIAPIRGTVLSRDVEIGSPVSSILNLGANATLVMTLGDIAQVFVRGKVDEADIRVRLGQQARIRVETFRTSRSTAASRDLADGRREGQRHQRCASRSTTRRSSRRT